MCEECNPHEAAPRRTDHYKVEYPFHAIDATLWQVAREIGEPQGATKFIRNQMTSGSVEYTIDYPNFRVTFSVHALDTRLCLLSLAVPDDGIDRGEALRALLDDIVQIHEREIAHTQEAEALLTADRSRGGRVTWPEDAEAIARLQAGMPRAVVKADWLKQVARNRKRPKIRDPQNRFRQLVQRANRT